VRVGVVIRGGVAREREPPPSCIWSKGGGCHQRGCCQRKRTPLCLAFGVREGVVARENRTQLCLAFGVRKGVIARKNGTHSVSHLERGRVVTREREPPLSHI